MKLARTGISNDCGWLSMTISAVALMPGRSRLSSCLRVARAGNVFSVRPIPRKLTAAIGLIQSSSAGNSRSAIASIRTRTFCPSFNFPRSTSSSFRSIRMLARSGISAIAAPVQARSPSLKAGGAVPKEPWARKFGRMLTIPSCGARSTHLRQVAFRTSHVADRFVFPLL